MIDKDIKLEGMIEFDEASGQPKGFNGLRLLEFATKQFGPEEVQKQLETVNLKIVPLNWQPDANPQAGATKARRMRMPFSWNQIVAPLP